METEGETDPRSLEMVIYIRQYFPQIVTHREHILELCPHWLVRDLQIGDPDPLCLPLSHVRGTLFQGATEQEELTRLTVEGLRSVGF